MSTPIVPRVWGCMYVYIDNILLVKYEMCKNCQAVFSARLMPQHNSTKSQNVI